MMREILFRGKRIDNSEWVYGDLIHSRTACQMWINTHNIECAKHTFIQPVEVIPESVGQYTGMTDKNGVKIFEGDILRNGYSSPLGEFWDIGNVVYVQTDGCFEICNFGESYLKRLTQTQIVKRSIEVIGNIHDNPKLLGGD